MPFNLPKINPDFVRKYPFVYAYMMLFIILGFVVSSYIKTNDSRAADCAEARKQDQINYNIQIDALQKRLDKDDSSLSTLYQQLLISNGIIDKLPTKIDSLSKTHHNKKTK